MHETGCCLALAGWLVCPSDRTHWERLEQIAHFHPSFLALIFDAVCCLAGNIYLQDVETAQSGYSLAGTRASLID